MTVYGEVLFAENFVTGAVILILTGKLCGKQLKKWRVVAASVMCGLYAFILFVPLHWVSALATKLIFSVVAVMTAFSNSNWRGVLKTAGLFYIVSFLMGGTTIALMYLVKLPFMTANGSFMLKGIHFLQIAAGVSITWLAGSWLTRVIKEKAHKDKVMRQVRVVVDGDVWEMDALIDTGNSLCDPVTGLPVAVLSESMGNKICASIGEKMIRRTCMIPYRSVGGRGILHGIRPDMIVVDGITIREVVLGIGCGDFGLWRGTERYDLLLHGQLIEGEDK